MIDFILSLLVSLILKIEKRIDSKYLCHFYIIWEIDASIFHLLQ